MVTIFELDRTQEHANLPDFVLRQHVEQDVEPDIEAEALTQVVVQAVAAEEKETN